MDKELLEEFSYSSQITLSSRKEQGVVMSAARWTRLKGRIRKCKRDMNIWAGFAFTLLGIGLPCAIQEIANYQAAVKADPPNAWVISIWGIAAVLSFALAICCFIGYRQARDTEADSLDSVLEEMDEIESGFGIATRSAGTGHV
jgi:hypothetical protein